MAANYWDQVASKKTFRHPLNHELFARFVSPADRVLDIGCGYGRILEELRGRGYANTRGVDSSAGMVARAKREHPHLDIRHADGLDTGEPPGAAYAVILFTVLTSVPDGEDQAKLVHECHRVLKPGGVVYVSDLYLNDDARSQRRYDRGEQEFGERGVFRLDDGGVMRHHAKEYIVQLFNGFERLHHEEFLVTTMNGNPARAFQLIARKT